ncbi:MAG TPA: hypothetical protein VIL78_03700 [Hanamia sp.]
MEISLSSYTNDEGTFSFAFISDTSARIEVQNKLCEQRMAFALRCCIVITMPNGLSI